MIYLDTHVLVWLYEGRIEKISDRAKLLIEENDLLTSPINILELQYLHEIKRINVGAQEIITDLEVRLGLKLDDNAFIHIVEQSFSISWTSDPFDRLLVASAQLRNIGSTRFCVDRTI